MSHRPQKVRPARSVVSEVRFVAWHAFAADRVSASVYAALVFTLGALPAVQVVATAALIARLHARAPSSELVWPVAAVVATVALFAPLSALSAAVGERSEFATERVLQSRLALAIARLSPSELADPAVSGEIESYSHAVIDVVSPVYVQAVAGLGAVASAVAVIATVWALSPIAALFVIAAAAPVALSGRYLSRASERLMRVLGPIYQRDRYLRGVMVGQRSVTELASLGTSERMAQMMIAEHAKVARAREITIRARIRVQAVIAATGTVFLGAAVVAMLQANDFGPSAVAGIYGVVAATAAAGSGSSALASLVQFAPQTAAVRAFLQTSRTQREQRVAASAEELRVEHLRHRYPGSAHDAVRDLSLHIRRGEMVALVGVNGAGKTTAIHATLGLIEPASGSITVDGHTREDLGEAAWLSYFGLLTQEFGRYEVTVREAVLLGTPAPATDEQVWAALDAAHAGDFVRALPDGLDTMLGRQWGGVGVSGGQWQRLALARTHLRNAPIWILDEPTSAIDAEAEQDVFAELGRTRRDRITIVVSHRAWTLRAMDHIYVIDQGVIVEHGTYDDLISKPGSRFSRIFAEQAAAPARLLPAGAGGESTQAAGH